MTQTIVIDMNRKCAECKKPGATENGICMGCVAKAFKEKPMKSPVGLAVQLRIMRDLAGYRSRRAEERRERKL